MTYHVISAIQNECDLDLMTCYRLGSVICANLIFRSEFVLLLAEQNTNIMQLYYRIARFEKKKEIVHLISFQKPHILDVFRLSILIPTHTHISTLLFSFLIYTPELNMQSVRTR
jgi:hypothetical protein